MVDGREDRIRERDASAPNAWTEHTAMKIEKLSALLGIL
jgi:hypothetical protein